MSKEHVDAAFNQIAYEEIPLIISKMFLGLNYSLTQGKFQRTDASHAILLSKADTLKKVLNQYIDQEVQAIQAAFYKSKD